MIEREIDRRVFLSGLAAAGAAAAGVGVRERRDVSETTIAVLVWEGVEELDLAGPLRGADRMGAMADRPVRVQTVAEPPGGARGAQCRVTTESP